ncbi:MAG: sodium-dependent transporter, partial [Paludibacteraceae bacterium]|nr:sodium-dependent transporter [Paludibacteraceae bacterium]
LTAHFKTISSDTPRMIAFGLLPIVLTAFVLIFDVNKGIERLSKILMPLLLLMMFLMAGRVLMMDGSNIGMQFFFQLDFSKITPSVIMQAMGQCFFSLSIGMGALITYGAYMPKGQNVTATSIQVITLDTMVAILAGIIIFPAVFAFGFNPAEGPELVFVVLPAIFEKMSFTWLSAVLFFGLLCIAAITSTISLMEVAVAFVCEASHGKLDRKRSVLIVASLTALLTIGCVICPPMFGFNDTLTSCIMMPLGALGMAIFVGWYLPRNGEQGVLSADRGIKHWAKKVYILVLRWLVPVAILIIFLNSLGLI